MGGRKRILVAVVGRLRIALCFFIIYTLVFTVSLASKKNRPKLFASTPPPPPLPFGALFHFINLDPDVS